MRTSIFNTHNVKENGLDESKADTMLIPTYTSLDKTPMDKFTETHSPSGSR